MEKRIIKLAHNDNLSESAPHQEVRKYDYLTVIRQEYTEDLMAYFVRSKVGILVVVNSKLTLSLQAKAISRIKKEIRKCGITETGILKKDFDYYCGGSCCEKFI